MATSAVRDPRLGPVPRHRLARRVAARLHQVGPVPRHRRRPDTRDAQCAGAPR
jgi:hypothetical protein